MDRLEPIKRVSVWQELDLFFHNREDREAWRCSFVLETSAYLFGQWFADRISSDAEKSKPLARIAGGAIYLSHVQAQHNPNLQLWVHCRYEKMVVPKEGPLVKQEQELGALISFKAIALTNERCKVSGSCLTPHLTNYYNSLLFELSKCWPEGALIAIEVESVVPIQENEQRKPNAKRDAEIFYLFMKEGKSRDELADKFGLSTHRIKQIVQEQRRRGPQAG